jgi:hypothetical protein
MPGKWLANFGKILVDGTHVMLVCLRFLFNDRKGIGDAVVFDSSLQRHSGNGFFVGLRKSGNSPVVIGVIT